MEPHLFALSKAIIVTESVELLVVWLLGVRRTQHLAAVALINVVTVPVANGIVWLDGAFPWSSALTIVIAECLVVVAEIGLLRRFLERTWRWSALMSLAMNAASATLGFLLFR